MTAELVSRHPLFLKTHCELSRQLKEHVLRRLDYLDRLPRDPQEEGTVTVEMVEQERNTILGICSALSKLA